MLIWSLLKLQVLEHYLAADQPVQSPATLLSTQLPAAANQNHLHEELTLQRDCNILNDINLYKITALLETSVWIWYLNDIFGVKIRTKVIYNSSKNSILLY